MIHAEISICPMGTGTTSASFYIARAIEALRGVRDVRYRITAMGTILESGDAGSIYEAAARMVEAVHSLSVARVEVVLKIDSRTDGQSGLDERVDSALKHLKHF